MSEKRFDVGQRVVAEDTEREGVVQEIDPAANAWWYAVEFGDGVLHYPHSLLRAIPADPAPTTNDELRRTRAAVDEAKAGVAEARGLDWQATALSVLVGELEAQSAAQQQRIAELTAALEPFARLYEIYMDGENPQQTNADFLAMLALGAAPVFEASRRAYEALHAAEEGA